MSGAKPVVVVDFDARRVYRISQDELARRMQEQYARGVRTGYSGVAPPLRGSG